MLIIAVGKMHQFTLENVDSSALVSSECTSNWLQDENSSIDLISELQLNVAVAWA